MANHQKKLNLPFAAALAISVAVVLLKAAHLPNTWAMTHYLFSYETGFTKRALFGELIRHVLGVRRFQHFWLASISIVVLAGVGGALLIQAWRQRNWMMVLFLSSPGAAYFVYTIGYLDHVIYGLTLLGLVGMRRRPDLAPWTAAFIGALCIFVHDGALLSALPLLIISLLLLEKRVITSAGVAIGLAALTCAASLSFAMFPVNTQILAAQLASKTDFSLHPTAIPVLGRSFFACLTEVWPYVCGIGLTRVLKLLPWIVLFNFWFLDAAWMALQGRAKRKLIFAACVAAAVAPLIQFIVAYDYDRWAGMSILNAYLALTIVARRPEDLRFRHARAIFIVLLVVGLFAGFAQFSGNPLRQPPFFSETLD